MAFFYISKHQFLSVLLFSYTFIASLLITGCSPANIAIFGIANSDIDIPDLPEKTKTLFLDQAQHAIQKQEYFSYTLDCADEGSFQEKTLNLNKALQEKSISNTGDSSVFEIMLINTTPECQQLLVNLLKDLNSIQLYKTNENEIIEAKQGELEVFVVFDSYVDTENSKFDISKIQVMTQGVESSDIAIILVILILLGLSAAGVVIYIRRKKKAQKKQLKVEKQKFIPRLQLSSAAPFNGQRETGSKGSSKKNKNLNLDMPKILSPNARGGQALRLEDNHHSSIINDNIFTNLDNSPRSVDDDSDIQSVKNTPKDIGFNIEFSMIEQDSKIKSARDHE